MNASDWKKAIAFVSQQKHAATAQTEQLNSIPLSALSLDDAAHQWGNMTHMCP